MNSEITGKTGARGPRSLLWLIMVAFASFLSWAAFAELDEVAVGEGKIIPSSRGQVIQSLEGGILSELFVREGDIVELGQKLAALDPAQAKSAVEEAIARIIPLQARAARIRAEIDGAEEVIFPADIADDSEVAIREKAVFKANTSAFKENMANLKEQLELANRELKIAQPLLKSGATNEVEVLRLKQKVSEISAKVAATENEYFVALKSQFSETMGDLGPLLKIQEGRADQLRRTIINSPARGIVKDIQVSTIGGVVPSGGVLMEIIPLDDQLLVETRLNPRDIAFIHPNQEATVKITAYESSIYGTLDAKVERVSPDTIEDNVDKRIYYYRAYVLTDNAFLETKDGKRHPILPGMIATTEIRTGRKTVLSYLLKPLNRASEALRER
ncbi:HlyD family efflux transporter periplasmic adaptor subunit [Brucella intermedia]|uniref:HlyD family efflux transporter periplasmic adaptor subunit n=1 Tax=Brucella intermedia TaxID=94625 RepID=UPI00124DBE88|nr:HlyD family efflux transporter periplasmic adaptor subunit [Brucella intermedia]KAB2723347.1 HlyD family efflux transporter periplasmic adaptor subunit [Brucella intermedia]